jgi:hypothetical protein
MKLYERLGLGLENVGLKGSLETLAMAKEPPRNERVARADKAMMVNALSLVAVKYYLLEEKGAATKHAAEVIHAAEEYFFGDWRNTFKTDHGGPDPMFWRRGERWMDYFSYGLGWGAALGDWEGLRKLAEYPDDNVPDEGEPSRKALYRAFASHLLGRPEPEVLAHLEGAGRKKLTALAAEALRQVLAGDAAAFNKALDDLLKKHRKAKFPLDQIPDAQSFDATFLVHLAEREGMKVELAGEAARDLVIRL